MGHNVPLKSFCTCTVEDIAMIATLAHSKIEDHTLHCMESFRRSSELDHVVAAALVTQAARLIRGHMRMNGCVTKIIPRTVYRNI